jgi:hypothetical protein
MEVFLEDGLLPTSESDTFNWRHILKVSLSIGNIKGNVPMRPRAGREGTGGDEEGEGMLWLDF